MFSSRLSENQLFQILALPPNNNNNNNNNNNQLPIAASTMIAYSYLFVADDSERRKNGILSLDIVLDFSVHYQIGSVSTLALALASHDGKLAL
jgi:hypothetical protein